MRPHLRSRMTARRATVSSGRTQCVISSAANPLEQETCRVFLNSKQPHSRSHHQEQVHVYLPEDRDTSSGEWQAQNGLGNSDGLEAELAAETQRAVTHE
jgi:hypothetical protein